MFDIFTPILNALLPDLKRAFLDGMSSPSVRNWFNFNREEAYHNLTMITEVQVHFGHYDGSRDAHGFEIGEGFMPFGSGYELVLGETVMRPGHWTEEDQAEYEESLYSEFRF